MADVSKITSELNRLKEMLDSGTLTQEEFDTLKTNLLAEMNQQESQATNRVAKNPKNNRNSSKKALVATLAAVVIVGDGVGAFAYSQQKGAEAERAKTASFKAKASSEKKTEAEKASREESRSASAKSASEKLASEKSASEQVASEKSASESSSNAAQSKIKLVQNAPIGHGFVQKPVTYDGMDAAEAMNNGAPQNLLHDGTLYFYFVDGQNVEWTSVGSYNPKNNATYTISDEAIILSIGTGKSIPYQVTGNSVTFGNQSMTANGHTIVNSFTEDSNAKDVIISK